MHCLKLSNCPDKNATIYFKLSGTLLEKLDIIEDSLKIQESPPETPNNDNKSS